MALCDRPCGGGGPAACWRLRRRRIIYEPSSSWRADHRRASHIQITQGRNRIGCGSTVESDACACSGPIAGLPDCRDGLAVWRYHPRFAHFDGRSWTRQLRASGMYFGRGHQFIHCVYRPSVGLAAREHPWPRCNAPVHVTTVQPGWNAIT